MKDCKETTTPMNQNESLSKDDEIDKVENGDFKSLIVYLMYLTTLRPDILFVVSLLYRFMHCASELHLKVEKKSDEIH